MPAPAPVTAPPLMPVGECLARVRVDLRTLLRWVAAGEFPRPINQLAGGRRMWRRQEVEQWIAGEGQPHGASS
jgi:predicted DNA-binding transcriptional regulator AlpA